MNENRPVAGAAAGIPLFTLACDDDANANLTALEALLVSAERVPDWAANKG
jgi:hypothetical protein